MAGRHPPTLPPWVPFGTPRSRRYTNRTLRRLCNVSSKQVFLQGNFLLTPPRQTRPTGWPHARCSGRVRFVASASLVSGYAPAGQGRSGMAKMENRLFEAAGQLLANSPPKPFAIAIAAFRGQVMAAPVIASLRRFGWAFCHLRGSDEATLEAEMLCLARQLGTPIAERVGRPIVARLQPKAAVIGRERSLSAAFLTGAFPCHVDTAHWPIPCRYIILACLNPSTRARSTSLLDTARLGLKHAERELLAVTPFRIVNGRNSFFATILHSGRPFIRYDPGCMRSVSSDGERALGVLCREAWPAQVEEVQWNPGEAVVIDNWRVLHGRGESVCDDRDRTLLRVYVN